MRHTELISELRRAGHRLTPQRDLILSTLVESPGHVTAQTILGAVRKQYPRVNKSAVYRTLDLLTELGLVHPTDVGGGQRVYELHRHPHHHHLVCRRCHATQRVDAHLFLPLQRSLRARYGFAADLDHFAVFGMCRRCQQKGKR